MGIRTRGTGDRFRRLMAFSTEEPSTVYAFDIDGVLTNQEGMQLFNEVKRRSGTAVGIVTTRSREGLEKFVSDNNLNPDFIDSTTFKAHRLSTIKRSRDADELVYVGSWFRDRVATRLAGWKYQQV